VEAWEAKECKATDYEIPAGDEPDKVPCGFDLLRAFQCELRETAPLEKLV